MSHAESDKKYKVTTPRAFIDDNLLIRSLYSFWLEIADSRKKWEKNWENFPAFPQSFSQFLTGSIHAKKRMFTLHVQQNKESFQFGSKAQNVEI